MAHAELLIAVLAIQSAEMMIVRGVLLTVRENTVFLEILDISGRRPCNQLVQISLGACISTMASCTTTPGTTASMCVVSAETNLVIWASFSWKMEQVCPPEADLRFF